MDSTFKPSGHDQQSMVFEDANGRYCKTYLVQRMKSRSKNNQVRLAERYELDYMGASQFERGTLGKTIRFMVENNRMSTAKVQANRTTFYVCYDPERWDVKGISYMLNEMFNYRQRLEEPLSYPSDPSNAWFDIEHGLFFTTEKINIDDIPKNLKKTVDYNNAKREAKKVTPDSVNLEETVDPLRARLIAEGKIKPRQ